MQWRSHYEEISCENPEHLIAVLVLKLDFPFPRYRTIHRLFFIYFINLCFYWILFSLYNCNNMIESFLFSTTRSYKRSWSHKNLGLWFSDQNGKKGFFSSVESRFGESDLWYVCIWYILCNLKMHSFACTSVCVQAKQYIMSCGTLQSILLLVDRVYILNFSNLH